MDVSKKRLEVISGKTIGMAGKIYGGSCQRVCEFPE